MAVTNLGLSKNSSGTTDYSNGCKVYANEAPSLYLKWRTVSGAEINASFDIAINYRYIPSGNLSGEAAGYTDWQTDWSTWTTVKVEDCNGVQLSDQSGWQWSYDLAALLGKCKNEAYPNVKTAFTDSNTFPFLLRKFDQAQIDVHIKSRYKQTLNGEKYSPRTDASVWIGYVPEYDIENIYIDSLDYLVIEYSADGWGRADDRWSLESLTVDGENIMASEPWGTVVRPYNASTGYGNGKVMVPTSKLTCLPVGKTVKANVRFNASCRPSGSEFANAEKSMTCGVNAGCPDPNITAERSGDSVLVHIAANASIESVLLKMEDAKFGFDQKTAKSGTTVRFDFVPRDVPITFSAIGINASRKVSNLVKRTVPAVPSEGELMLISLADPTLKAAAKLNVKLDDTYATARKTVKLAGRKRETAFYGEGGSASWSLSFSVLPESAEPNPIYGRKAWHKVSDAGDCVMFYKGERTLVSLGQIKYSRPYNTGGAVTASVSLTEVSE